jgi:HEAT repeats
LNCFATALQTWLPWHSILILNAYRFENYQNSAQAAAILPLPTIAMAVCLREEQVVDQLAGDFMMAQIGRGLLLFCLIAMPLACGGKPPYEGKSPAQLIRMLESADTKVQAQGAFGLSLLGPAGKPAVPALADKLKSPDSLVRQNAALALGKIGPEAADAVPALVEALHDADWPVRRHAALALGEIGPAAAAAAPALQKLNSDSNQLVRKAAQQAFAKIRK